MSKDAKASQVSIASRGLLTPFRGAYHLWWRVALKTWHLICTLLFHIHVKSDEGEQQNCFNSVQKLVWSLKVPSSERKSKSFIIRKKVFYEFVTDKGQKQAHLVVTGCMCCNWQKTSFFAGHEKHRSHKVASRTDLFASKSTTEDTFAVSFV